MEVYAEAPAQRRGDQSGPRCRADQGEFGQIEFNRTRRRPLPDHQIKLEILHRGIENLFNRRVKAMNLVNEEHVAFFKIGEQRGQIARLFDHRPGRGFDLRAHLAGDYSGHCGLAETRRPIEQHMIQRLAARAGGLDEDAQIVLDLLLADVFAQDLRAQREFNLLLIIRCVSTDEAEFIFRYFYYFVARHQIYLLFSSIEPSRWSHVPEWLITLPTFSTIVSALFQSSHLKLLSTLLPQPFPPPPSDNRD